MTLTEAIDFLNDNNYTVVLNEDFSIGVSTPCGCDQGIPHSGDGKGCAPVRMGLWQRSPFSTNPFYQGVPDAHHPDYWLNQIHKKKKQHKKKKHRKLHESEIIINDQLLTESDGIKTIFNDNYTVIETNNHTVHIIDDNNNIRIYNF